MATDRITISKVPPRSPDGVLQGGFLEGSIKFSGSSPAAHEQYQVVTFRWTNFAVEDWPVGWKPAGQLSTAVTARGTWKVLSGPGEQFAAMRVKRSSEFRLTGEEPFAAGTLPLQLCGNHYVIKAEVSVVFLSGQGEPLAGLVTGLPCALEDPERLTRDWIPHEHELLKVVAWAKTKEQAKCVGVRRCDPSGAWSFPAFDWPARHADEYCVGITRDGFVPTHDVPPAGGLILALACRPRIP
jgi:hypothetical protein